MLNSLHSRPYTSTNSCINASHRDIFLMIINPFIKKTPDTDEVNSCECLLTI